VATGLRARLSASAACLPSGETQYKQEANNHGTIFLAKWMLEYRATALAMARSGRIARIRRPCETVLPHTIGVICVGEENADTDEYEHCSQRLDHWRASSVGMVDRALFRNWR
jgi:hypothetical protein